MVFQQILGPFRAPLSNIAQLIANRMETAGLKPPPIQSLEDALIVTALVFLLSFVSYLFIISNTKRDTRNAVLILGISGDNDAPAVGKTALFKVLRFGQLPKHGTVPSMQVNEASFAPFGSSQSAQPLRWIDFPGHPRLRHKLPEYLKMARCVVFVIDAQRFTAQARKDAQLLFNVLTDPVVVRNSTPVLVFCNKSETPNSASAITVQTRLEAELERTRAASNSTLQSASVGTTASTFAQDGEEQRELLGYENEKFVFDHAPGPVTFASGSAMRQDIDPIINFTRSSFL